MQTIESRIHAIQARIAQAAEKAGRCAAEVTLVAVSKTRGVEDILQAFSAGCRHFGESYVQEAVPKIERLAGKPLVWHFIGPIQSNKTRDIARHFHWAHSVDRLKIARRLSEQRPADMAPLCICIQVNISGEAAKSGVHLSAVPELAEQLRELPRLRLRGLMAIARKDAPAAELRDGFAMLRGALQSLNSRGLTLDTLSMGMSGDFERAIAQGATHVRIGSGIFGPRARRPEPNKTN